MYIYTNSIFHKITSSYVISSEELFWINCCMMRSISMQNLKTIAVENQILGKKFSESLLPPIIPSYIHNKVKAT